MALLCFDLDVVRCNTVFVESFDGKVVLLVYVKAVDGDGGIAVEHVVVIQATGCNTITDVVSISVVSATPGERYTSPVLSISFSFEVTDGTRFIARSFAKHPEAADRKMTTRHLDIPDPYILANDFFWQLKI